MSGINNAVIKSFRTFEDLLNEARKHPELPKRGGQGDFLWSVSPTPDKGSIKDWSGTDTFDEAMRLAEFGWPEGKSKIKKEAIAHNIDLGRMHVDFGMDHDVAGEMVDVGRFLDGDPENMVTLPDAFKQGRGRTVEILVNITTCCNQCGHVTCFVENPPGNAVTLKGLALMMLIQSLEESGYIVDVLGAIMVERGRHGGSAIENSKPHIITFPIQRAGDYADMDRLSFILMHPAMFRRIGFSLMENLFGASDQGWREYGHAVNAPSMADIYIPAQSLGFRSTDDAKKWVEKEVAKFKPEMVGQA